MKSALLAPQRIVQARSFVGCRGTPLRRLDRWAGLTTVAGQERAASSTETQQGRVVDRMWSRVPERIGKR